MPAMSCDRRFLTPSHKVLTFVGSRGLRAMVFCLAGLLFAAVRAWAEPIITRPYEGVTYIVRSETSPRNVIMHIAVIDLTAPGIQFKITPHGGTRDSVRQTTLDFLNARHAQLAINCHFMVPYPSPDTDVNLAGLAVSEGRIYSRFEPQPVAKGFVDQSYAIVPYAPALNISRELRASIVHRDPSHSDNKHVLEDVKLWTAVSGSAQIVSNGVKTIPPYSGSPGGLNPRNGYSDSNSWYQRNRARTAVGVAADGRKLVLFTVDEAGGSGGMTIGEVADVLIRDYQVRDALNLDGGGSTTLAMQDSMTKLGRVVNVPSDAAGRSVGSSLAVFARPIFVPPLHVAGAGNGRVMVSWPAPAPGWRLQHCFDLGGTNWSAVSVTPQQIGDRMQVLLTPERSPMFFRLSQ